MTNKPEEPKKSTGAAGVIITLIVLGALGFLFYNCFQLLTL